MQQVIENNCAIIYSKNLTHELDNFFTNKDYFLGRDYFLLSNHIFDEIQSRDKNDIGRLQRIKFLKGAYVSHGNKNQLFIRNDLNKTMLIYEILCRIADEYDEIKLESFF